MRDDHPFGANFWSSFLRTYFRQYVPFLGAAAVICAATFAVAHFAFGIETINGFRWPVGLGIVPFFLTFGRMAFGYHDTFADQRKRWGSGLFWRFNVFNGGVFWAALWLAGGALSVVITPSQRLITATFGLSMLVSFIALVDVSAIASR
jgi:hypothetical protein